MSLLFCLQFSPYFDKKTGHSDQESALYLARLIADNEPHKRFDVEFAISYRPDSSPVIVEEIAHILHQKFQTVHVHKSLRSGTGWPHGCNDLWFDTMSWAAELVSTKRTKCTGILTFESDNLPLKRDWINILINEWKENHRDMLAVGNIWPIPIPHVNGNGMFSMRLQDKLGARMHGCAAHKPWDLHMAKWLLPKAKDTNELSQVYNGTIKDLYELAQVKKNDYRPALLHGLKGIKHLELAKRFLSLSEKEIEEYEKGPVESRAMPEITKAAAVAISKVREKEAPETTEDEAKADSNAKEESI